MRILSVYAHDILICVSVCVVFFLKMSVISNMFVSFLMSYIFFFLLQRFKAEAYQQQIELERLNHQKELLQRKATDENDKLAVEDSFKELKHIWQALDDKIINRQVIKIGVC